MSGLLGEDGAEVLGLEDLKGASMSMKQDPVKIHAVGEVTLGPITPDEWGLLMQLVNAYMTTDKEAGELMVNVDYYAGKVSLIEKLELLADQAAEVERGRH